MNDKESDLTPAEFGTLAHLHEGGLVLVSPEHRARLIELGLVRLTISGLVLTDAGQVRLIAGSEARRAGKASDEGSAGL